MTVGAGTGRTAVGAAAAVAADSPPRRPHTVWHYYAHLH